MDQRLIFGFGVSVVAIFIRYLFPNVPKPLAVGGLVIGASLVLLSYMPHARTGPAILGVTGITLLAAAIVWQVTYKSPMPSSVPAAMPAEKIAPEVQTPKVDSDAELVRAQAELEKQRRLARKAELRAKQPENNAPDVSGPQAVANERVAVLRQLTQLYIASHDDITSRMMVGMEFPSAEWLNGELDRQGAKWRVKSVNGTNAETYDIGG